MLFIFLVWPPALLWGVAAAAELADNGAPVVAYKQAAISRGSGSVAKRDLLPGPFSAANSLLFARQSCSSGEQECKGGCIPIGAECCGLMDGYCESGYYCTIYGCCEDGSICNSSSDDCTDNAKQCGDCMWLIPLPRVKLSRHVFLLTICSRSLHQRRGRVLRRLHGRLVSSRAALRQF